MFSTKSTIKIIELTVKKKKIWSSLLKTYTTVLVKAQTTSVTTQIKILAQFQRCFTFLTNKSYTKYGTSMEGSKKMLRLPSYRHKEEMN